MRKILFTAIAMSAVLSFIACKKSDNTSSARTVQNLSGSYILTSLVWTSDGISNNLYDSLPDCEKDNILRLDPDGSAHTIDVKILCNPPEADSVTTWSLSANGDSLYFGGQGLSIKSWDGKKLVYTGVVIYVPFTTAAATLVKQ
jgi:hypothetical protein